MNRKIVKGIAVAALAGTLAAGGTAAYLTDYDQAVNEFTVGKVEIELEEPNWKPEENTKIVPSQVIKKDPQVKNTGKNDAFVYLEVSVPTAEIITAAEDGSRGPKGVYELFSFAAQKGWTQIDKKTVGTNVVYTYSYDSILKPGETTGVLFHTVSFVNIIEGQLDTQTLDVPVRAYAIQTANTGGETGSVPDMAKKAYQKYVNQNSGQEGKITG